VESLLTNIYGIGLFMIPVLFLFKPSCMKWLMGLTEVGLLPDLKVLSKYFKQFCAVPWYS